jgi:hypothetical protein
LKSLQSTWGIEASVQPRRFARERPSARPSEPVDVRHARRKAREIAILQQCLRDPLALPVPRGLEDAIAQKLAIASALRAERSLQNWTITETARPEVREWHCGPYRLSFGYQRADLVVRGPSVYPHLDARRNKLAEETIYTASGMSALATLITALLATRGTLEVIGIEGGYAETRELLERFRDRVRCVPVRGAQRSRTAPSDPAAARIVWLDSAVSSSFARRMRLAPHACDLVVVDTTCFWRGSARIRRLLRWARERDVPLALVRSHAKLDCLGIEYGRMGSIVLAWRRSGQHAWMRELSSEARSAVRLLGCAAVPAHFPPFVADDDYAACSAARTASIIRNTRRLARRLCASTLGGGVTAFQHGLYLTLAPRGELRARDVRRAAEALCEALASQDLPVRHAGSFGFDFVALEWFPDPQTRRNLVRIAPGDVPLAIIDRVADGIVRWFQSQSAGVAPRRPASAGTAR